MVSLTFTRLLICLLKKSDTSSVVASFSCRNKLVGRYITSSSTTKRFDTQRESFYNRVAVQDALNGEPFALPTLRWVSHYRRITMGVTTPLTSATWTRLLPLMRRLRHWASKILFGTSRQAQLWIMLVLKATAIIDILQYAQIWNHNFFWNSIGPIGVGVPMEISDAIVKDFGSFESFRTMLTKKALSHFGSGWIWFILRHDGVLDITDTHDASNPIRERNGHPLLTIDVWEHAYYIDHKNDRASYVERWFQLINWDFALSNYRQVRQSIITN